MFRNLKLGGRMFLALAISAALVFAGRYARAEMPSSNEAIEQLKAGNTRFVSGTAVHLNTSEARRVETAANGQHPIATILSCSDSRVPVERIFDQGIGDIFSVRVAGNVCDTDETGSIEYAVGHLETPLLVVLGHTECGAVTAVVTGAELHGRIPELVDNIQPAVAAARRQHPGLEGKALVPEAVKANVWQGIEDLLKSSPTVRERVKGGRLKIAGAVYDLESGQVEWMGAHPKEVGLLAYTGGAAQDAHGGKTAKAAGATLAEHSESARGSESEAHGEKKAAAGATVHAAAKVESVPVTLIPPARLAELDRARQRKIEVAKVQLDSGAGGLGTLWTIAIALAGLTVLGLLAWRSGFFAHLGVAGKLYAGFTTTVLVAVGIGGGGYYFLHQVQAKGHLETAATELDMMVGETTTLQEEFLRVAGQDKTRAEEILKEHKARMDEFSADQAAMKELNLDEVGKSALAKLGDSTAKYAKGFGDLVQEHRQIEGLEEEMDKRGNGVDEQLNKFLHEQEADLDRMTASGASAAEIDAQTELVAKLNECASLSLKVTLAEHQFSLDKKVERVQGLEKALGALKGMLKATAAWIPQASRDKTEETAGLAGIASVERELQQYEEALAKTIEGEYVLQADTLGCTEELKRVDAMSVALSEKFGKEAEAMKGEANIASMTLMAVAAVLGALLAIFITRGVTKPVNRIISGLNEGADQVNDAAGQVSSASQQLAEGASEQAASLEETSSALEQMAAMTRTNAGNAKEANELAGQARQAADEGDRTMHKLNEAMVGISESSEKISKIIKVIEEIAFQTNLLALNAAVEAARAGEHGKGFAVVADEVRNLAQRCAQAARETTGLIEGAVNKSLDGTRVAGEVGKALTAIVGNVSKVSELIAGISQASQEQAQGVDQVNIAVSQMDKVTQQNASGAEESASAAEELSAQAASVKAIVEELSALVSGDKGRGESNAARTPPTGLAADKARRRPNATVAGICGKPQLRKASTAKPQVAAEASKTQRSSADKSDECASEDFLAFDNDKEIAAF